MNESTISQPNHSRHPEKCADTADLQKTIENMHNLAEISFGQIGSLIAITLCAMKAGTCRPADIGNALEAIAYLAEDADGVIYGEAMAAGCASQAPVNAYPASNPLSVIKV
ncbi:MAG: hypothetical protein M0Q95_17140 [Porticoccaceae bacterium]|nr:hypothetical protein [Porticoccaceae bacterium]